MVVLPVHESQDLPALLSAADTLAALDDATREKLAAAMQPEAVTPGQVLLRQGEAGDALFVIAQGQLEVRVRRPDGS